MGIKIHPDSHVNQRIPFVLREYVLDSLCEGSTFCVQTVVYPESFGVYPLLSDWRAVHDGTPEYFVSLPALPCALHLDVPEHEVRYATRGYRSWPSRLCSRAPRMVREVTVVGGPHPDDPEGRFLLLDMYAGPQPPREPGDPSLHDPPGPALGIAEAFWASAALSEGG